MITYRITTTDRFPGKYLVGNTGQGVRGADLAVDGENGLIGYLRGWVTLPADNDVEVRGEFISLVSGTMPEVNEDGSIYATAAFEMLVQPYFDGVLTGNPVTVAWVADAGGSISGAARLLDFVASGGMTQATGVSTLSGGAMLSPLVASGSLGAALIVRRCKLVLTTTTATNGVTPAANQSGIRWAWYDTAPPNLAALPAVNGVSATTNASGLFDVALPGTSLMTAGQAGTLLALISNGVPGSAGNIAFCGPVAIS